VIQRFGRTEDGQALAIAAVAMLGLALGVLATVQVGRAVHQRIHVQNIADAEAYSVAAAEARAYNFWAFSNRAQVTHYNGMMGLQAYVSYLYFTTFALASITDDIYRAASWGVTFFCCPIWHSGWGCCCKVECWGCPPVDCSRYQCSYALQLADIIGNLRDVIESMQSVADGLEPVLTAARVGLETGNRAAVQPENLAALQTASRFITRGSKDLVKAMDDQVNRRVLPMSISTLLRTLNRTAFLATLEPTAQALVPGGGGGEESRRIMAELANGSRYNNFVSAREVNNSQLKVTATGLVPGSERGQTKLITSGEVRRHAANPVPEITQNTFDRSVAPTGDYLASEDTFSYGVPYPSSPLGPFLFSTGREGSYVVAGPNGRQMKKWSPNPSFKACPRGGIYRTAASRGNNDEEAGGGPRFQGIAPYMRYVANSDSAMDFGQPSVWSFINKAAEHIDRDGRSGPALEFRLRTPEHQNIEFNSRIGAEQGLFGQLDGVNAMARAMVYYHRPGNWKEHPNFFNPFWRAKLAPVGHKLTGPLSGLFGGNLNTFLNESLVTH
jgi:hypothetical protein